MLSEWKFRPTLGPTLFTIPALIVLVFLGSWQVQPMNWKNDLVASFEEKMAKAPVAFPQQITDM